MTWGSFGVVHIFTLFLAAAINVGLYFLLKKAPKKVQIGVLGVLSFSGIAAIIFNLVTWGSPLEYLPLHLCSITAILLPIAVLTRNKQIGNMLLLWCIGAMFALIVNSGQANFEVFSWTFGFYYFPHVLELGIPIILFKLGLIEKDYRCIGSTLLLTMLIYTGVHCVNVGLNSYFVANNVLDYAGNLIQVNYMFSFTPENPLLQLFYKLIPYKYWYMYLVIPVIAAYLSVVYLPEIVAEWKTRIAHQQARKGIAHETAHKGTAH